MLKGSEGMSPKNSSCKIASESNQLSIYLYNVDASDKPCNLIIQFDHVQLEHVFIASFDVQVHFD